MQVREPRSVDGGQGYDRVDRSRRARWYPQGCPTDPNAFPRDARANTPAKTAARLNVGFCAALTVISLAAFVLKLRYSVE